MTTIPLTAVGHDQGASAMLRNLGREADATHSKFAKMAGGLKTVGSVGASASGRLVGGLKTVGTAGAGVALGIGAIGAAAVKYGLDVASGNEQAKIGFTTMLGSAKKADAFLRQMQAFAAKTPFEFPELQKAASGLV